MFRLVMDNVANFLVFGAGLAFMTTAFTFPIDHFIKIYMEGSEHIPMEYAIILSLSAICFVIGRWMTNKTKDFCINTLKNLNY